VRKPVLWGDREKLEIMRQKFIKMYGTKPNYRLNELPKWRQKLLPIPVPKGASWAVQDSYHRAMLSSVEDFRGVKRAGASQPAPVQAIIAPKPVPSAPVGVAGSSVVFASTASDSSIPRLTAVLDFKPTTHPDRSSAPKPTTGYGVTRRKLSDEEQRVADSQAAAAAAQKAAMFARAPRVVVKTDNKGKGNGKNKGKQQAADPASPKK
jgi:hypothetical protein